MHQQQTCDVDLPSGHYIPFHCNNERTYKIYAAANTVDDNKKTRRIRKTMKDENGEHCVNMDTDDDDDDDDSDTRKHYYFYSKYMSKYNKKAFIKKMLKRCNASLINDLDNWTNASKTAQFLIIDEYSRKNRFTMAKLMALTSGDASAYCGKQYHGYHYKPRTDAQVIIFSKRHLFHIMGTESKLDTSDEQKTISEREANILMDRFFIYKLNSIESDETSSSLIKAASRKFCEERNRLYHTECEDAHDEAMIRRRVVLNAAIQASAEELKEFKIVSKMCNVSATAIFSNIIVSDKLAAALDNKPHDDTICEPETDETNDRAKHTQS